MPRRRHTQMKPYDLYVRYPHADLLPIPAPTPLTEWSEWESVAVQCGDGLFSFLIRELADTTDWEEALSRIATVSHDVDSVLGQIYQQAELEEN